MNDPLLAHFELLAEGLDPCPAVRVEACCSVPDPDGTRVGRVLVAGCVLSLVEAEGLAGKLVRAVGHARRMEAA